MQQPACANCGMTEINFICAAAAGWRRVLRRMYCKGCVRRFPAWMHTRF